MSVSPSVTNFTNLSSEHGDFHKTKENYFEAKCKLFGQCKTAVFNIDDCYARRALSISKAKKNITTTLLRSRIPNAESPRTGLSAIFIYDKFKLISYSSNISFIVSNAFSSVLFL